MYYSYREFAAAVMIMQKQLLAHMGASAEVIVRWNIAHTSRCTMHIQCRHTMYVIRHNVHCIGIVYYIISYHIISTGYVHCIFLDDVHVYIACLFWVASLETLQLLYDLRLY